ncbi:MAG: DUF2270 domain-containing protein [Deltaproteobacteria bacterium]|nr:DUF2270 domain-containing protein [Deltaproteobacteria bacterium]
MPPPGFDTVLVHLYRGELGRSDRWRNRLDNTTNWALTTAAAVTSFTFTSPEASHAILVLGGFLVWTFLLVESRRYRYYDLWIRRVRLIEDGFVAAILREEPPDMDTLRELADLITRPRLYVSFWDALGLRLRRTYAPILSVLTVAWIVKLVMHPTPTKTPSEVVLRAHIGIVPGSVVFIALAIGLLFGVALYLRTFLRPLPRGELRPRPRPRLPLEALFRRPLTGGRGAPS